MTDSVRRRDDAPPSPVPGEAATHALPGEGEPAAAQWSCGHAALGTCGECHRLLAARAAALQARLDDTEEALDNILRAGAHTSSAARAAPSPVPGEGWGEGQNERSPS